MENVLVSYFKVESEAFQALSELKEFAYLEEDEVILSQAAILKKVSGTIIMKDSFDTGKVTANETLVGTMVGGLVGILGGPLGVLLGVGLGGTIGVLADATDVVHEAGLIQSITSRLKDGDVAIVAVVQEELEAPLDRFFSKFDTIVHRYDASEIQEEIDHAKEVQRHLERQACERMAEERSERRKQKVEAYKEKLKEDFSRLKERLK